MGRTKLTEQEKLNSKLMRLQKEIERIKVLLAMGGASGPSACKGPDRTTEVLTIDETNPEDIDRRDGIKIDKEE